MARFCIISSYSRRKADQIQCCHQFLPSSPAWPQPGFFDKQLGTFTIMHVGTNPSCWSHPDLSPLVTTSSKPLIFGFRLFIIILSTNSRSHRHLSAACRTSHSSSSSEVGLISSSDPSSRLTLPFAFHILKLTMRLLSVGHITN